MAPPKKKKAPGDGDGGARVDRASDVARGKSSNKGETTWLNPREPLPDFVTNKLLGAAEAKPDEPSIVVAAKALVGINGDAQIVAATIIAQALDRLGKSFSNSLKEAAAIGRYRSGA